MKKSMVLIPILGLIASAVPAGAHPGHSSPDAGFLAFWRGAPAKAGTCFHAGAVPSDFWRMAFVSKYRIVGVPLPTLVP